MKQAAQQNRVEGKRNSMGQLPKAQVILASRHQTGETASRIGSALQKVDLSTSKEVHTPSDLHALDSTMPKNPRKQQRLTKIAEEKKGDQE